MTASTQMHKTISAHALRDGNLLHVGGTNYVLVAKAEPTEDGQIAVTIYNGDTPQERPFKSYEPQAKVQLSTRGPVV
ncbi:hypothetical protein ACFQVD_26650 [Streptosporangium amethystogenes subsp. fukuiense]|uniref:Uncharacterized protein n=1 Tax=Streptosporangium amethystogenes subsp. fukuiense TaxID=698418 RepID=A0ABW2T7J5_9ACTN